ncbi:hypothetical protein DAPPUDRAFT_318982 [Daphnia pulex]|uniref:Uncharacterized protein n=1 Tax=Daphnia pulex TaxID=6669 RepID=E9GKC5_DAPPU|nr:hypothetical protein DAPPUDRAFT_318982 [Daphnia pulex]|eukprot:EFX79966.1 hypothetical protein DAPPUDRAFT_318982 [Daphnia pulex]
MESDQELDESILSLSQIDYENLEVTDEVGGDDSIEEIIVERKEGFMGSRDKNKSEEVEKGSVEKSSKKHEERCFNYSLDPLSEECAECCAEEIQLVVNRDYSNDSDDKSPMVQKRGMNDMKLKKQMKMMGLSRIQKNQGAEDDGAQQNKNDQGDEKGQ